MGIVEAVEISIKWQRAHDAVYKMLTLFEPDEMKYKSRMKLLQAILKSKMPEMKHSEITPTILTWCKEREDDDRYVIQILAAGYELLNGNDYCLDDAIPMEIVK